MQDYKLELRLDEYLPLRDVVFNTLRQAILTGELKPGERLMELHLAGRLGVSRTPVREALKRLEQQHLVEDCGKGLLVLSITAEDARIIYQIRERLEGLAAAACASRITEEEINTLKELIDLQLFYAQRNDSEKVKQLDSDFHKSIYRYAGSSVYYDTLMPLHTKIQKFRKATVESTGKAAQSAEEHRTVLDAITSHDEAAAEKAMTAHIRSAGNRLYEYLEKQEKLTDGDD